MTVFTTNMLEGDCDCCGKFRTLIQCWTTTGLETWACAECRYETDLEDREDDDDEV